MGEWVVGAFINIFGSIAINLGTNLLKLGHNERERHSMMLEGDGTSGKLPLKPIIHFHTWRVGFLFFLVGNCLNFISFGYAAQSLLAALGSVQFLSNIAFAYFVLNKMVTGEELFSIPFSYAIVSGAIGSFSVLFAKSLSNLLRLVMSSSYQLHSWIVLPSEDIQIRDTRSLVRGIVMKISEALAKAKTACALSLGFGEDSINASAVLVMPMVSSKITGFRGNRFDRSKIFSMRNLSSGWGKISMNEGGCC